MLDLLHEAPEVMVVRREGHIDARVRDITDSPSRWSEWTKRHQAVFLVGTGVVVAAVAAFTVLGVTSE